MNTGIKVPKPKRLFENSGSWFSGTPQKFIETPLAALNEIIVGLPDSELILIAAKPSQGKTALAMQMAFEMANSGEPVGIFSMEMSRKQLGYRIACSALGVDSNILRNRFKTPVDPALLEQIEGVRQSLEAMDLYVDDRGGLKAEQVYASAHEWKQEFGIKAIFLDYIQLLEASDDNRQEAIGSAGRLFKQIAKELEIPFIALSQVNRAVDSRDSKIPRLSDLRDSGQLEQVADTVLMFSYPNSPEDDLDNVRECQIHVKKQRNGPTGIAHVQFNKKFTKFEPLNPAEIEEQAGKRGTKSAPAATKPQARQKQWSAENTKEEEPS